MDVTVKKFSCEQCGKVLIEFPKSAGGKGRDMHPTSAIQVHITPAFKAGRSDTVLIECDVCHHQTPLLDARGYF